MPEGERTYRLDLGPVGEVTFRLNPPEAGGISSQTLYHFKEANRYALLAMRAVLDRLIERIEASEAQAAQPTRIRVEADESREPQQPT